MDLLVPASTLWGLASMGLILPLLGAPAALTRTAVVLLVAEFLALLAWGYERGAFTYALSHEDIPALSVALFGAAVVFGVRGRRTAQPRK